jgi:NAD(P)-dependent dehydrogenase (short-subunit alcohol dehydrogenase family)
MANLFAQRGSNVTAVDVVASRVDEVVGEINRSGRKAMGMVRDLSVTSEPEAMINEVVKKQGRIDILCNNAGIMDAAKPVAETGDDLWDRVLNINLNAAFRASRRVIPAMIDRGGGVILNTASVAGLFGGRAGAAYTVSKHGLIGLTKSIAVSYGSKGIRCNAMVLGAVKTAIGLGGDPSPLGLENLQKTMATMPRMAEPMEIAKLALFLVSDESSFVNGSCVTIDAGWTAC